MSDTMAGLIRAERILSEQEQHLAADSVAEAIRALNHWLEQVEKVEALADDLTEDWEEVTPDQIKAGDRIRVTTEHGDIAEYTVTHVDTSGWVWGHSGGRDPSGPYVWHRWVPADPDAALLAIVDADTLARLREVAEVTAR